MALVPFHLALVPLSFLELLRPSGLAPLKLKIEDCDFTKQFKSSQDKLQYYHSDLYCDITLYLATTIGLQLRSILDLCEIGPSALVRLSATPYK